MGKGKAILRNSKLQRQILIYILKHGFTKAWTIQHYVDRGHTETYRQINNLIKQKILIKNKSNYDIDIDTTYNICKQEIDKINIEFNKKLQFWEELYYLLTQNKNTIEVNK